MPVPASAHLPGERSAWEHDLGRAVFPLRCVGSAGAVRRRPLGDVTLVELDLCPQTWRRTPAQVRAGGHHLACTLTVLRGRLTLHQDGRDLVLVEGTTSVVDGARPFALEVEELARVIGVLVERDVFARRCAPLGEAAATPPTNRGTADPVAAFVARLPTALDHPDLTPVEGQRLGSRTLDVMQLVFTPSIRTTNVRDEHLTAAKTYIDDHLTDPDLSPRKVAAGAAVSIRYLHELFRSTGETVRQRIIRRRLDLAYAALTDPRRASVSVSTIAADCGFKTAAHFSRCFVDLYGHTATEVRAATTPDPGGGGPFTRPLKQPSARGLPS